MNTIPPIVDDPEFTVKRSDNEAKFFLSGFKASDNNDTIINGEDQVILYNGPPEKFQEIFQETVFNLYTQSGNLLQPCSKELFNQIYQEFSEKFIAQYVNDEYRIVFRR